MRPLSSVVTVSLVATALLFALPLLLSLLVGAEPQSESLGVRYFTSARLFDGESRGVWVPQGHFLGLFQHVVYALVDPLFSADDLRGRWAAFGYGTNACVILFCSLLLAMVWRSNDLRPEDKFLVAIVTLSPVFSTGEAGLYYSMLPDYYHLNIVIFSAAVALFVRNLRAPPDDLSLSFAVLGVFAGLATANKITMLPIAAAAGLPLIRPALENGWGFLLRRSIASLLYAFVVFLAVQLTFYFFRPSLIRGAIRTTREFLGSLPVEAMNPQQMATYLYGLSYAYIFALFVFALIAAIATIAALWRGKRRAGRSPDALMVLGIAFVAAVYLWFSFRKPTGTTFFEVANALIALGAMLVAMLPPTRVRITMVCVFAMAAIAMCVENFSITNHYAKLKEGKKEAELGWRLFASTQSLGRPVIVVVPNNEYFWSDPYEALLKGISDAPTWNVTSGKRYLDALKAPVSYRTDATLPTPREPYDHQSTIVLFQRTDLKPLIAVYPELAKAVGMRTCAVTQIRWSIEVFACVPK